MSHSHRRLSAFFPLALAALVACQGDSAPTETVAPQFGVQPNKGVWTVTSLADPGAGACTSDSCTLRQALAAAQDGEKVVFKGNVSGVIALEDELIVGTDITIDGGGRITLDAQGSGRVLQIESAAEVSLIGLVVMGGRTGNGGGIRSEGALTIRNSRITANEAFVVGGGISSSGPLTLITSTVDANLSQEDGGGIYSNGPLTVLRSTISGNTAYKNGAGIHHRGGAMITESTISGNTIPRSDGESRGGGIFVDAGAQSQIRNSTIVLNEPEASLGFGGGVWVDGFVTFANTIVAGNHSEEGNDECSTPSSILSLGHNVTRDDSDGCPFNADTDVRIELAAVFTEVLEQALKENGGPTKTHALIERGRAVDAGYCPGVNTDQRGLARPYDELLKANVVDACDIGAFEWRPPVVKGKPGK